MNFSPFSIWFSSSLRQNVLLDQDKSQGFSESSSLRPSNLIGHSDPLVLCWRILCLSLSISMTGCGSRLGQKPPRGEWIIVLSGDSVSKLAEQHQTPMNDIIEINALSDPSRIIVGQSLFIPQLSRIIDQKVPVRSTRDKKSTAREGFLKAPGFRHLKGAPITVMRQFSWPIKPNLSSRIGLSSPFGQRKGKAHRGIDLSAPQGTLVRAALDGEVIRSEFSSGGYGWVIYLKHAGGVETRYAHHQKNLVKRGRFVQAGEVIAKVGNSGRSSGPHLHFELRINGEAVDPLIFLPALSSAPMQNILLSKSFLSALSH